MGTIIAEEIKGKLAIRIENTVPNGSKLINSVHVEQLSETSFKVSVDFTRDPVEWMTCNVSTGDGWDGVDFQTDVDKEDFSWMSVMFKWMGVEKTDLEISWRTWETGDDTDRVHFPSLFVSEILVTQVNKREEMGSGLTIQL